MDYTGVRKTQILNPTFRLSPHCHSKLSLPPQGVGWTPQKRVKQSLSHLRTQSVAHTFSKRIVPISELKTGYNPPLKRRGRSQRHATRLRLWMASRQRSNTAPASSKSMGTNFLITPSSTIRWAQLSGPSKTIELTPNSLACNPHHTHHTIFRRRCAVQR